MLLPAALKKLARGAIVFLIERHPLVLVLALLLAGIGGYYASKLQLDSDITALLPEDYHSVKTMRRAEREVGGFQTLQILLEGDDFEALKGYADELAAALEASPNVLVVDYKKDVEFFEDRALLYAEIDEVRDIRDRLEERIRDEKLASNPLWIDLDDEDEGDDAASELSFDDLEAKYEATDEKRYYVDEDLRMLALKVYPNGGDGNISFARGLYREAKEIAQQTLPAAEGGRDPPIQVYYGGSLKNKLDEYVVILDDVRSGAVVSLTAVLLLMAVFFRNIRAAVAIAISLSIGIAWTFGLAYWMIGGLNIMTVFLFVVLFGLGIDFGIHLYARYAEERSCGLPARHALATALATAGAALTATAVTTAIAFFSLLFADFKGFSEFGFIAGTGVLMTLVSVAVTLPALILLGERIWPVSPRSFRVMFKKPGQGEARRFPRPGLILVLGAGLAVFGLLFAGDVKLQYDFTKLRASLSETQVAKEKLGTIFDESNSPAIVVTDSAEELAEVEEAIRAHMESDPTPTIDKFRSIYTALPADQEEKLEIIADIRRLLDDDALGAVSDEEFERLGRLRGMTDVAPVEPEDLPDHVRRIFQGKGGSNVEFGFIFPAVELRDGKNAIAFAEDVRVIEGASGRIYHAANTSVVVADMLLMMVDEGKRAFLLTFLAVFAIASLTLRSIRRAMLVLIPLAVGIAWLFLVMFLTNWKLNFFNIVVIPAVVGIGIDSGIHLFLRCREEGRGGIVRALTTTGFAVSIASITTMLGFLGLALASHPGMASIGLLAVVGIGLTLLAALAVLPAALQLRDTLASLREKGPRGPI